MTQPSDNKLLADASADLRRPRPLSALLTAEAVAQVAADGAKAKTNGGRWRLNAGSEMQTCVWGLNMGRDGFPEPIRCVIDCAAMTFEQPKIPALFAHSTFALIGNWTGLTASDDGVDGDLALYLPRDANEAPALVESVRVKAMMDQDHPWQASVGAYPRDGLDGWEAVDDDGEIEVNGRVYAGAGELPLFVMRNPVGFESSVVLWGADSATGRIAAAILDPVTHLRAARAGQQKDPTMSTPAPAPRRTLKATLAAHKGHEALVAGLFSDDKTDAEIDTAVNAAKDARIAELEAANATLTTAAAAKPEGREGKPPGFQAGAGSAGAKDWNSARAEVAAETKLKGLALNEAVFAKYPDLRDAPKPGLVHMTGAGRR